MKDNNYEFCVGDEVETVDGTVGKIVSICHCERCAKRGFFELRWETPDGKYSDYITVNQANWGFPYYRRIGKYVWDHDTDEEKSAKNILQKENKKMKEIKLTIDGKEVQLTDEQLRMLLVEKEEKRKNPFEEPRLSQDYYFTNECGIGKYFYYDKNDYDYGKLRNAANVFTDETFTEQVALHQLLYRRLLKFAYDNECEDSQIWGGNGIEHWHIVYDFAECAFYADWASAFKHNDVYFSTKEDAKRAIKEVVEPFMKEHPEFKW